MFYLLLVGVYVLPLNSGVWSIDPPTLAKNKIGVMLRDLGSVQRSHGWHYV